MKLNNITTKTIRVYATILLVTVVLGCEDELDLENPNSQTTDQFWLDSGQAFEGINAVYNSLLIDGYYMRMTPALTDVRGDEMYGDSPWLDLNQVGSFIIPATSGPVQWTWSAYYQAIFRANQVLENVPTIEMDENQKNRILGQAYFLRALSYFNLKNNFQKVPLITTVPVSEEEFYPPTAEESAIWEQIITDLSTAQGLLPVDYSSVSGPDQGQAGRATRGAATAYLGKAYLYTQQWGLAADEFAKLINGPLNNYSLAENYQDNFSPFISNNSESIFEVQFSYDAGGSVMNYGGEPNSSWRQVSSVGHTYAMDGYGYSDFLPTRWLYEEYKEELTTEGGLDPRLLVTLASYEPTEGSTTVYGGAEWPHAEDAIYPRKYTNDGFGLTTESYGGVELSGINYRLMRYSDVLLMYAEALNESGQTAAAAPYIQEVRDRANLPDREADFAAMTQQQLREQIAHERSLEFALEGKRIHDLVRWGWLYDNAKLEELKAHDSDFETWTPGKEYLPIPQTELDVNPNLQPNDAN